MALTDFKADQLIALMFDAVQPVRFINERLKGRCQETTRSMVARYWLLPIALVLLVDLLAIHFAGYDAQTNVVLMPILFITGLIKIASTPFLLLILVYSRMLKSELFIIAIAFTPIVLLQPLLEILNIYGVMSTFKLVNFFTHNHYDFQAILEYIVEKKGVADGLIYTPNKIVEACMSTLGLLISTYLLVVACETICLSQKCSRFVVYLSVSLASSVSILPQFALQVIRFAVTASYAPEG